MANGDYNSLSEREILLVVTRDVKELRRDLDLYRENLSQYMSKAEIQLHLAQIESRLALVEKLLYGAIATILLAFIGGLIALIIPGMG